MTSHDLGSAEFVFWVLPMFHVKHDFGTNFNGVVLYNYMAEMIAFK